MQVADAISASRPGARGESLEMYVKRLEDLQAIANSFPGVERIVRRSRPAARSGSSSARRRSTTSRRPASPATSSRKIEESLTYPGQIKVTVIRETRAVEYAK